jgi:uncharacterized membrane protein YfcA
LREKAIAALAGLVTGAAAGLVGVGGGEFRMPVLVRIVKFPLRTAAGVNLVVGLATVTVSLWRRWAQRTVLWDEINIAVVMIAASLMGSVIGSLLRKRLRVPVLRTTVSIYLVIVGAWMVYEAITHTDYGFSGPSGVWRVVLAFIIAFVIAVVSGVFGVAGGEMRIPALMYLFGIPIKAAGTLSLLVSIPTVAGAAATDRRIGHLPNTVLAPALILAVASIVGVLVGASFVATISQQATKGVLGVILILATVRMATAELDAKE